MGSRLTIVDEKVEEEDTVRSSNNLALASNTDPSKDRFSHLTKNSKQPTSNNRESDIKVNDI